VSEADPRAERPGGWYLGRESWSFHRQFFERCGRAAVHHEYTDILWQIRLGKAERVSKDVYRVKLADGAPVIVRGGNKVLLGVLPPDWTPPAGKRASTLTLGAKATRDAATKVLSAHLQRIGIPAREVIGRSP